MPERDRRSRPAKPSAARRRGPARTASDVAWRRRAAGEFERLLAIMQRLRAPDGCPWDREQTLDSLKRYLLEECYECLAAIEGGDPAAHRDELGDVLLQIIFQAEIRRQAGDFDAGAVCTAIAAKLVRRHPHIFGSEQADTAGQVIARWETIKAAERAASASGPGNGARPEQARPGALAGVPAAMPQLMRAAQLAERAGRQGFDWPAAADVLDKIEEELGEWRAALAAGQPAAIEHELGDVLMALANLGRKLKLDPEQALRHANERFIARFGHVEARAAEAGKEVRDFELAQLEAWWQEAKRL